MTQEEKQLLLKDLCARLPYGVKGLHRGQVHELFTIDGREVNNACIQVDGYDAWFPVDTFKPYLRPMSSMTDEEEDEYWNFVEHRKILYDNGSYDGVRNILRLDIPNRLSNFTDWLNSNHFDYRGLIEKSLALIAPEGMYES